jgi:hypothetical protein
MLSANPDGSHDTTVGQLCWRCRRAARATVRARTAYAWERDLLDWEEETVPTMLRSVHRAFAGVVLPTLGLLLACVSHDPEPAFRASVLIGDRGISIPLPPPSLVDAPEQEVDVEGEVLGVHEHVDGLVVRIVDHAGGAELDVPLVDGSTAFHAEGLAIDLSDNCLELWLVDADGREGERAQYRALIDATGQAIEVSEGCD